MKAKLTEVGRVVRSTQGRDKDRLFVVTQVIDEHYVLMCDGDTRKLAKPKRKQVKHLQALPATVAVEGRGASGGGFGDSDLRKSLAAVNQNDQFDGDRESASQEKEECAFVQRGCH